MTTNLERTGRPRMESDVTGRMLPILIQVPKVGTTRRLSGSTGPVASRRRRRLRKEVRVAGMTMLSVVPMGLLMLTLGGARPASRPPRSVNSGLATIVDVRPTVVAGISLGFDSSAPGSTPIARPRPTATVQFPGYLLPDDGSEDLDHAGR